MLLLCLLAQHLEKHLRGDVAKEAAEADKQQQDKNWRRQPTKKRAAQEQVSSGVHGVSKQWSVALVLVTALLINNGPASIEYQLSTCDSSGGLYV
jgi:hypothetical protein